MSRPGFHDPSDDTPVGVSLRVGEWQIVDGAIDNTVATAAVSGASETVEQGQRVRRAGWAAVREHPRSGEGSVGWPPTDDDLTVLLPLAAWRFVITELERGVRIEAIDRALRSTADEATEPDPAVIARVLRDRLAHPH